MAYRLDLTDTLGAALRSVAAQQLDGAARSLGGEDGAPAAAAVHDARKRLKKTRALLRLARPALGREAYARENVALREAARALAATRDADVLRATTAALADRYAGQVPATTFEALETAFAAQAVAERAAGDGDGAGPAQQAAEAIAAVRTRVDAWPLDDLRRKTVIGTLRRTYERGRGELGALDADADAELVHEWRKRVKDLWYQQRLLADAWPPVLAAQIEVADTLAELLGDDHDLAVLAERLRSGDVTVAADVEPVAELADRRRAELLDEALRLGARVYAERPKAFAARMRAYLDLALDEAREAPGAAP